MARRNKELNYDSQAECLDALDDLRSLLSSNHPIWELTSRSNTQLSSEIFSSTEDLMGRLLQYCTAESEQDSYFSSLSDQEISRLLQLKRRLTSLYQNSTNTALQRDIKLALEATSTVSRHYELPIFRQLLLGIKNLVSRE